MRAFADIEKSLDAMTAISLEEMGSVKLMNRVDQKYMMDIDSLAALMELIKEEYYVQRINGSAKAQYHTLYFDTPDLDMYTQHHNRKLNRQKLRVRCYEATETTFFEIKRKNNRGKTKKKRIEIENGLFENCLADKRVEDFIAAKSNYQHTQLTAQLENRFERITLVDKRMKERVTIDTGLTFMNRTTQQTKQINGLVVMEVKREVDGTSSIIDEALNKLRIFPRRMSKYCIGTAFTNPNAKSNRFKEKIRAINKITKEYNPYDTTARNI